MDDPHPSPHLTDWTKRGTTLALYLVVDAVLQLHGGGGGGALLQVAVDAAAGVGNTGPRRGPPAIPAADADELVHVARVATPTQQDGHGDDNDQTHPNGDDGSSGQLVHPHRCRQVIAVRWTQAKAVVTCTESTCVCVCVCVCVSVWCWARCTEKDIPDDRSNTEGTLPLEL